MIKKGGFSSGFTIVELLIVIVIIGILAAIVIVAYNGIQSKAQQSAIYEEMTEWQKLFVAYKSVNGSYPNPSPTGDPMHDGGPGSSVQNDYCLGTGFPNSTCFWDQTGTAFSIAESRNAALMSQLATIGSLPPNSKKYVYDSYVVGPFLQYQGPNSVYIWGMFPGGTTCPSGTTDANGTPGREQCYIALN